MKGSLLPSITLTRGNQDHTARNHHDTPNQLYALSFSPRKATPQSATLSLSMGATRDASPSCSAWK
jgi:hypothetical protein